MWLERAPEVADGEWVNTEHPEPTSDTRRRTDSLWWPPYVVFLFWVAVSVPVLYLVTVREQTANPPTCFGIGWGCTPDPASTIGLYLMFIAAPALAVAAVILVVAGLLGPRTRSLRLTLSAGLPPLLFLGVFVLS